MAPCIWPHRSIAPHHGTLTRCTPRAGGTGGGGGRLGRLRNSALLQTINQRVPQLVQDRLERRTRLRASFTGSGYHYEASEVARALAVRETTSALMPLSETIALLDIIDTARTQFTQQG